MKTSPSGLRGGAVDDNSAATALEQMDQYSMLEKFCLRTGRRLDSRCGRIADWVDTHKAEFLGLVGIFAALLVVWPLTRDCRRRSRQHRLRESHRLDVTSERGSQATGETSPLARNGKPESYGTSNGS